MKVILGSENGLIKTVNLETKTATLLEDTRKQDNSLSIDAMCWLSDENGWYDESKIFAGYYRGDVHCFQDGKDLGEMVRKKCGGKFVGMFAYRENLVTCNELGRVIVSKFDSKTREESVFFETGENVHRMRPFMNSLSKYEKLMVGGNEHELQIWDLEKKEWIWQARNVPNDKLSLRVPVWVTDMRNFPNSDTKVAIGSAHGQIRVYDIRKGDKRGRPVLEFKRQTKPVVALEFSPVVPHLLHFSNNQGEIIQIDMRNASICGTFKGGAGSTRGLSCHPTLPLIACTGLDRYLRVYDINTKKLKSKIYVKQKMNHALFSSELAVQVKQEDDEDEEKIRVKREKNNWGEDKETHSLWDNLPIIKDDSGNEYEKSESEDETERLKTDENGETKIRYSRNTFDFDEKGKITIKVEPDNEGEYNASGSSQNYSEEHIKQEEEIEVSDNSDSDEDGDKKTEKKMKKFNNFKFDNGLEFGGNLDNEEDDSESENENENEKDSDDSDSDSDSQRKNQKNKGKGKGKAKQNDQSEGDFTTKKKKRGIVNDIERNEKNPKLRRKGDFKPMTMKGFGNGKKNNKSGKKRK